MTRDDVLARLRCLLPSQFDEVIFRAEIPCEYMSGTSAPQATRAVEALRFVEQRRGLDGLVRVVDSVLAAAGPEEPSNE